MERSRSNGSMKGCFQLVSIYGRIAGKLFQILAVDMQRIRFQHPPDQVLLAAQELHQVQDLRYRPPVKGAAHLLRFQIGRGIRLHFCRNVSVLTQKRKDARKLCIFAGNGAVLVYGDWADPIGAAGHAKVYRRGLQIPGQMSHQRAAVGAVGFNGHDFASVLQGSDIYALNGRKVKR